MYMNVREAICFIIPRSPFMDALKNAAFDEIIWQQL
jgi:hypothetical protein